MRSTYPPPYAGSITREDCSIYYCSEYGQIPALVNIDKLELSFIKSGKKTHIEARVFCNRLRDMCPEGRTQENIYIAESPVSGFSVYAKEDIPQGHVVSVSTSSELGEEFPFFAAAPQRKYLEGLLMGSDESLLESCATAVGGMLPGQGFVVIEDIKKDKILAHDYVKVIRYEPEKMSKDAFDMHMMSQLGAMNADITIQWVRRGVAPSLMDKYGEPIADVAGKVRSFYISGFDVYQRQRDGSITKMSIEQLEECPDLSFSDPNVCICIELNCQQLHPNDTLENELVGEIGTSLFVFDRQLHEYFQAILPETHGASVPSFIKAQKVVKLAGVSCPPQFIERHHLQEAVEQEFTFDEDKKDSGSLDISSLLAQLQEGVRRRDGRRGLISLDQRNARGIEEVLQLGPSRRHEPSICRRVMEAVGCGIQ